MNHLRNSQCRDYAILEKKIKLLENAYYHLCLLGKVVNLYDEGWQGEKDTYSNYLYRIMTGISSLREEEYLPFKICFLNTDQNPSACPDTLKRLSSPDYYPSAELLDILNDLRNLWAYWVNCRPNKTFSLCPHPGVSEDGLELALAHLMRLVGKWETLILKNMDREVSRTSASTQAKKKKEKEDSKHIINAFYSLQFPKEAFPKGASFHKVAGMIEAILDGKFTQHPGIDKIKRILRRDKEIWGQFKEIKDKGRKYFIKQV
jgi:hypothetical protein